MREEALGESERQIENVGLCFRKLMAREGIRGSTRKLLSANTTTSTYTCTITDTNTTTSVNVISVSAAKYRTYCKTSEN